MKFFLILLLSINFLYSKVILTDSEKNFIKNHPKIVLGTEKSWEPYVIVDKNGIRGYDVDILKKIYELTGLKIELKLGVWRQMQKLAKERKIDGLSTGGIHKERREYLNFSDIYISMEKMLLVAKSNPKDIKIKEDLIGKTIVIHRGNLVDEKIAKKFPNSKIIAVDTIKEMIEYVIIGKADATFGNGATLYLANKLKMPFLQIAFLLSESLDLAFGVRKDYPEAISIINKALANIDEHEKISLINRWFVNFNNESNLNLSLSEKKYLIDKKEIKMCVDPDWMPFEEIDENGNYVGIVADIFKIVEEKLNTDIKVLKTHNWQESLNLAKNRVCDITSSVTKTPNRAKYLNFTSSFLSFPLVVASKKENIFIDDFKKIANKKFALIKGYAGVEILKNRYPNIKIVEVKKAIDGLNLVLSDKVFGYIDTVATIGEQIKKHSLMDIKIISKVEESYDLRVGVDKENRVLLNILQKAIDSIDEPLREKIKNRWIFLDRERVIDYTVIFEIIIVSLIIVLIILYSNSKLRKLNREIEKLNTELEDRVKDEVSKNREKDRVIFQQSKMASMGELIGNIAHQWRNPISEIGAEIMKLETELLIKDEISKDSLKESISKNKGVLKFMSQTIDTFQMFYKNRSNLRVDFSVKSAIDEVLFIASGTIKDNKITITKDIDEIVIGGIKNEFEQVILSILLNAKDIFIKNSTPNPKIEITAKRRDRVYITIRDNGDGVKIKPIEDIFLNQVSTNNGCGIGLYLSKKIIEEKFSGEIRVENIENGAEFSITI